MRKQITKINSLLSYQLSTDDKLVLPVLLLLSLGQLQRFSFKTINFYAHDLMIVLYLLIAIARQCWQWQKTQAINNTACLRLFSLCQIGIFKLASKFVYQLLNKLWQKFNQQSWLNKITFIYLPLVFIIHNTTGEQDNLLSWLYILRWLTYFAFIIVVKKKVSQKALNYYLIIIGLLFSFWGLMQYYLLPDTRFLKVLGWDDHYYRLLSTQLDPNYAGILLILFFWQWQKKLWQIKSIWHHAVSSMFILSLTLTYSRSSYLAFIASLVFHITFSRIMGWKKDYETKNAWQNLSYPIIYLAVFLLIFIFNMTFNQLVLKPTGEGVKLERTASSIARINSLTKTLNNTSGLQWLIGKGVMLKDTQHLAEHWPNHAKFPPNLLVLIIQFTGIIGLGLASYQLIWFFYKTNFFAKNNSQLCLASTYLAVIVHSQFNHTLLQAFVLLLLGMS